MKIINPTENEITIQYKGTIYSIPAMGSKSGIAEDVANYWQTMIHNFIVIEADGASEEEVTDVVPPVEIAPEPVEETPVVEVAEKPITKRGKK